MENKKDFAIIQIKANGQVNFITREDYRISLAELYKLVDCDTIQIVPCHNMKPSVFLMCIDDNGKLKGKNFNLIASYLYAPKHDYIVGDAVIGIIIAPEEGAEPDLFAMKRDLAEAVLKDILEIKRKNKI